MKRCVRSPGRGLNLRGVSSLYVVPLSRYSMFADPHSVDPHAVVVWGLGEKSPG